MAAGAGGYVPVGSRTRPARSGDIAAALTEITEQGIVRPMPFHVCIL